METTIKTRSELNEKDCWDLTPLYADAGEWEKDFAKLDDLLTAFLAFKGRLAESPAVLRDAFRASDELDRLSEQVRVYACLKRDEDTADSVNSARRDRINAKGAEIAGETAWFDPELMAIPQETFDAFRSAPELAFYKRTLDETERQRKHTLSAAEERILGMSADALATSYHVFGALHDADMRFPKIPDGKGGEIEITNGNYAHFLENPDRSVRKAAYDSCYDTYKSLINTYASILDGTVKTGVLEAKLRNHASAREMALSGDNIPLAVYDNLVDTVHEYLPALHRYFKLRADVMGMEKITMYDIMNPLVPESVQVIPWEEAERLVKRALQPLGETYCDILGHAFTDRWIDIRECRGKRSGAYSWGCYRLPPYLLLNHSDDLESVFTLAHELGHSMHSYFSDRAQDYHYAGYRIFAAEVASTTNELLLYHDLMAHATDDAERASLGT
ncbi:MAG: oligoendopeptidase F family protein [Lentisphaeria bacterium]|nr:oligoendopeptidase F family protein [Lentisphaeria bacterium]